MLALGGVLICLFLAYSWKVRNSLKEISIGSKRFKLRTLWTFNIKYLCYSYHCFYCYKKHFMIEKTYSHNP